MSPWCAYTWRERLQRGKLFLHTSFFVINALVPWITAITILACLQTFVVLQSRPPSFPIHQHFSPHHNIAPLQAYFAPREGYAVARPCQLNHGAVATATPNGSGVTCCSLEPVLGPHPFLGCRNEGSSVLAYLWISIPVWNQPTGSELLKRGWQTSRQTARQNTCVSFVSLGKQAKKRNKMQYPLIIVYKSTEISYLTLCNECNGSAELFILLEKPVSRPQRISWEAA